MSGAVVHCAADIVELRPKCYDVNELKIFYGREIWPLEIVDQPAEPTATDRVKLTSPKL